LSERDGKAEVYTLDLTTRQTERVTNNEVWDGQPAWSPDGSRLAFTSEKCTGFWGACYRHVMVADTSGANPVEISMGEDPTWSRDGSRIAITTFSCSYYDFYNEACFFTGIGIVAPFRIPGYAGSVDIWEAALTHGPHRQPTWRP
jgi:Tol biopolymer transport system component